MGYQKGCMLSCGLCEFCRFLCTRFNHPFYWGAQCCDVCTPSKGTEGWRCDHMFERLVWWVNMLCTSLIVSNSMSLC